MALLQTNILGTLLMAQSDTASVKLCEISGKPIAESEVASRSVLR